ncbi:hypothetical protein FOXYSP1_09961 [Fusarium oxysporum f. sp. phaseoli]
MERAKDLVELRTRKHRRSKTLAQRNMSSELGTLRLWRNMLPRRMLLRFLIGLL